jgi:hypothetical protein
MAFTAWSRLKSLRKIVRAGKAAAGVGDMRDSTASGGGA